MATHVVTGDQYRVVDRRMSEIKRQLNQDGGSPLDPEHVAKILQAVVEGRLIVVDGNPVIAPDNIVTVTDISAATLIARAKQDLALTYLDEDFAKWDFLNGEGGKRYERLIWTPGRSVRPAEVRTYFRDRGFNGNTAVFVTWVATKNPEGYFASIPDEDDRLWRRPESGRLCAPYFVRDGARRRLGLVYVAGDWCGDWSFVAFREIP